MHDMFRPRSNYAYTIGAWLLIGGMAWADCIGSEPRKIVGTLLAAAVADVSAYLLFWHPRIRVSDDGVEIRNPMSDHEIGWQDVLSVDTRYTLSFLVHDRRIHAWAAPGQGRYHTRTLHPADVRHLRVSDGSIIHAGESPRAHSGVAAHLVRTRQNAFAGKATVTTRHDFHRARLIALCLCAAAAVLLRF